MTRPKKKANMSRQPPLTHGLPPRPQGTTVNMGGGESYRPQNANLPPRPQMREFRGASYKPSYDRSPPSYDRGPPGANAYRPSYDAPSTGSGYDDRSYRPSYDARDARRPDDYRDDRRDDRRSDMHGAYRASDSYRPAENTRSDNFNFRYDAPPGLDFNQANRGHSPPRQRHHPRNNGNYKQNNRGGWRGRGGPRMASDREFLKTNRAPTPDLMPGMEEEAGNGVKYVPIENLSDSDEAEMDISGDEDDAENPKKKSRVENKATDGDSVPRWSNPDPYTVLPPIDESQRKKDIVKLIRKARVATDTSAKPGATTDDFISFDFDDDDQEDKNHSMKPEQNIGVNGAPTGPRSIRSNNTQHQPEQPVSQSHPINDRIDGWVPEKLPVSKDEPRPIAQPKSIAAKANRMALDNEPLKGSNSNAQGKKPVVIDLTSDPALGSRKRNFRDQLKPPPEIHQSNKGTKAPSSGKVVPFWMPLRDANSCPWMDLDHSDSAGMGVWLHKEIMDFYHYVKPLPFEEVIRSKLIDDLNDRIERRFNGEASIRSFGSFPAGLYLPTADMDLVMVSPQYMSGGRALFGGEKQLRKFGEFLRKEGLVLKNQIEIIAKAKVPLVKYVDRVTGLKVDISFENDTGLIANKTFQDWKTTFPAMPILVTLIKHLLTMRGLNEPFNGGIGGFSVTCLVVSLLQQMPQVQSRTMIPEHHLGEILMEFLDLYGNQFDTYTTAISTNPPAYISKAHMFKTQTYKGQQDKFTIIDPNNPDNDISGGSSNTKTVRLAFSRAYKVLQDRMAELQHSDDRECASILGCIIGGNYSSFKLQRDHLRHIHETIFGPV